MQGLLQTNDFRTFYYKNNEFGTNSLAVMGKIFVKPKTSALLSLRLVNCRTANALLTELLQRIDEDAVYLRSLGLVQMGVRDFQLDIILRIMQRSDALEDLDLSWNGLIAKDLKHFFKTVAESCQLININLAWNQMLD